MAEQEQTINSDQQETDEAASVPPVLSKRVPDQVPLDVGQPGEGDEANPESVFKFDLFKHPACVVTLLLLSALIAYSISDSLPMGETYVAGFPYRLFALVTAAVGGMVWLINNAGKVPPAITTGLALVAAAVGAATAHPALLRVNAATDIAPMQVVEYVRATDNHFEPVAGDWPRISMPGKAHWLAMTGDVRRIIPVRRGGLGFYQADLTGIRFELELSSAGGG